MKVSMGHKRRRQQPPLQAEPVVLLRRYAIKLFNKDNGRAVDWPKVAETAFKVAFSCLDEMPGDDRALSIIRRVHDGAYNRLVGTPDSATPYLSEMPEKPPFAPGADQLYEPDFDC